MPVEKPPTQALQLPGVGKLAVWSGQVDFVIPVWAADEIASLVRSDNPDHVTIELDVAYQACDDTACRLPRTERLTLDVPVERYIGPSVGRGGSMPGAEMTSMDSGKWRRVMVKRGLAAAPDQEAALSYMQRAGEGWAAGPLGQSED